MVGLLAASTGTSLLIASRKNFPSTEIIFLALLSTLSFAAIDLYYVSTGTISKIYLSDAFEELLLVILFSISLSRQARTRNEMA